MKRIILSIVCGAAVIARGGPGRCAEVTAWQGTSRKTGWRGQPLF